MILNVLGNTYRNSGSECWIKMYEEADHIVIIFDDTKAMYVSKLEFARLLTAGRALLLEEEVE